MRAYHSLYILRCLNNFSSHVNDIFILYANMPCNILFPPLYRRMILLANTISSLRYKPPQQQLSLLHVLVLATCIDQTMPYCFERFTETKSYSKNNPVTTNMKSQFSRNGTLWLGYNFWVNELFNFIGYFKDHLSSKLILSC